ncbi:Glycoside hydrolase family 79 protein [Mycena venus]|uniref:Glycoside hydrolase family 79 protein n=1 Tax=Mycena venus TaxID=2733690 RepID=A0A8H7D1Z8_9AGAR|nr:Glycoside hydrolase family 79 protein [Mycena venus]
MRLPWISLFFYLFAASDSALVSIPLLASDDAPVVTGDLLSFSIGPDRWLDWAGNTSRNEFFYNALNNLVKFTGTSPSIRIGALGGDPVNYNPNLEFVQNVYGEPSVIIPYPEPSSMVVGLGYYQAAQFLPAGTKVTWGVNLVDRNLTAVYLESKAIIEAFASPAFKEANITLDFLEVGNEPDLYVFHGYRSADYNFSVYLEEWTTLASNVTKAADLAGSKTRFWGGVFAGPAWTNLTGFTAANLLDSGILTSEPGSFITAISQHLYSGLDFSGNISVLNQLMSKATIRSNLTAFVPDIKATRAKGLDYVLGETNSYAVHGAANVSNAAGAALWALDYTLSASQIGISKLFFEGGIGYKYNLLQPVTLTRSILDGIPLATPLPPHIQPTYYAAIVLAEAIGDSGNTQAVELAIEDDSITGYAFYEQSALKRALFINLLPYLSTQTTPRASTHLNLSFSGSAHSPASFSVKRLTIGYADDTRGVTFGGQTYETVDALVSGSPTDETGLVSQGIDIAATEAVFIAFN